MALNPREQSVHQKNLHRIDVVDRDAIDPFSSPGEALSRRMLSTPAGFLGPDFVGFSVLPLTDLKTGLPVPPKSFTFGGERSLNRALFEAHRLVDDGVVPVVVSFGLPMGRFKQATARAVAASLPVSATPPALPTPPKPAPVEALAVPVVADRIDPEAPDAIERAKVAIDGMGYGIEEDTDEEPAAAGERDIFAEVLEVFCEAATWGRAGGRRVEAGPELDPEADEAVEWFCGRAGQDLGVRDRP